MTKLKSALMGATLAVTAGAMLPTGAMAATTNVYGGGSSLIAPYARQAMDCYATATDLVIKGADLVSPSTVTVSPFNYTGAAPVNCATTHHDTSGNILYYISTGSGTGINGVYAHDATLFGDVDPTTSGTQNWPSVQYGFSDTSLDSNDVSLYVNGGSHTGTHVGVDVAAPNTTPTGGQVANPNDAYGAMVQFPMLVAPVAIVYDPVYKKVRNSDGSITEYKFRLFAPRGDNSGGLRLDAATYCKIFTGQITNWNDPAITQQNHGVLLKDAADPTKGVKWSVPMQIVGRSESSGTSSIFTRHLANVCAGSAYASADATTTLPGSLLSTAVYDKSQSTSPAASGETLGKFTTANGNDGVAKYVNFSVAPTATAGNTVIQGRIGYAGLDYALPGSTSNPADPNVGGYALNTATLRNAAGKLVAPTASSALAAFGVLAPPQSDANGNFEGSASGHRNAPGDWIQPATKTSILANPAGNGAYPIVGTTNFIGYTCYADKNRYNVMRGFLFWYEKQALVFDTKLGLLAKTGLAPLPERWRQAILTAFYNGNDGQGLNINYVNSTGGHCSTTTHPHLTGG